jgi:hypothetical protein
MRKMGVKLALLGAFAGAALLSGCNDHGRAWAQSSQREEYYPHEADVNVRLHRGGNTGFPRHIPLTSGDSPEPGTGGSGFTAAEEAQRKAVPESLLHATDAEQKKLWLKQDERVPFPPPPFSAQAALELGTGRPLRTGPQGAWIQGVQGVELGSGVARTVASSTGSAQQQAPGQSGGMGPSSKGSGPGH